MRMHKMYVFLQKKYIYALNSGFFRIVFDSLINKLINPNYFGVSAWN